MSGVSGVSSVSSRSQESNGGSNGPAADSSVEELEEAATATPDSSESEDVEASSEPSTETAMDEPADMAQVAAERDAYLEDLQRVTAEFANFRRQTERRNADTVAQAASRLVADLLPVLDACEAAASQGVEGIDAANAQLLEGIDAANAQLLEGIDAVNAQLLEGIDAVNAQLLGVLCGRGLSVLGVVDEPFDPNCHEAVMAEESDHADGGVEPVVAEVLRTGYAWRGRVLRAAMVKVRS